MKQDHSLSQSQPVLPSNGQSNAEPSAKHTPGPWKADFSKYRDGEYIVQAQGPSRRVLAVFDGDGDGYDPTDIANANLIAAAPDLLEALKDALFALEATDTCLRSWNVHGGPVNVERFVSRGRAAIAKAEGQQ